MSGKTSTATTLLGAVAVVVIVWWSYGTWTANKANEPSRINSANEAELKRFQEWAYVAKDKEIKPGERLKLVIVPSPWGDYFDTKCLIYTNDELKQSSMICPDANKDFIKESEQ
jgi:hypothetical protein